jgi:hypothetical protein
MAQSIDLFLDRLLVDREPYSSFGGGGAAAVAAGAEAGAAVAQGSGTTRQSGRLATTYNPLVPSDPATPSEWTAHELAAAQRWVRTWERAGPKLEAIRREELRRLDPFAALQLLMGPADYTSPPRALRPTSGLVEQQRWFMRLRASD